MLLDDLHSTPLTLTASTMMQAKKPKAAKPAAAVTEGAAPAAEKPKVSSAVKPNRKPWHLMTLLLVQKRLAPSLVAFAKPAEILLPACNPELLRRCVGNVTGAATCSFTFAQDVRAWGHKFLCANCAGYQAQGGCQAQDHKAQGQDSRQAQEGAPDSDFSCS